MRVSRSKTEQRLWPSCGEFVTSCGRWVGTAGLFGGFTASPGGPASFQSKDIIAYLAGDSKWHECECAWLFVSVCEPCDWLADCTGRALPLMQCQAVSAQKPQPGLGGYSKGKHGMSILWWTHGSIASSKRNSGVTTKCVILHVGLDTKTLHFYNKESTVPELHCLPDEFLSCSDAFALLVVTCWIVITLMITDNNIDLTTTFIKGWGGFAGWC